jgi:hypothetical protein
MTRSYIVNDEGKPTAVVVDYESFIKMETLPLDYGLGKAMEEVANDEEVDLEEAKRLAGFRLRRQ